MKYNYFTKIENKYVFNVSLIFWHVLILCVSLAIIVSLGGLLWSVVPAQKKQIDKKPYPQKQEYPQAIKVDIAELHLEEKKDEPQVEAPRQQKTTTSNENNEDAKGIEEYQISLNKLKELIASKASWDGSGKWYYPYGERYWQVYKDEQYRQWVIIEPGIEDKLNAAYKVSNATNYSDKKSLLDGYIEVITLVHADKRADGITRLINNVINNVSTNRIMCQSLTKVITNLSSKADNSYISILSNFYKNNPKDGVPFIEYISIIINKFSDEQQNTIIERLTNSYYNYFNQNLTYLKESTDSFLQLLPEINSEIQAKALLQYYKVYVAKNVDREKKIAQIENEYKESVSQIDIEYTSSVANAEQEYMSKQLKKAELKLKSLSGIGGGILAIVLIGTILVFLSIQRSVRKIEEKITSVV